MWPGFGAVLLKCGCTFASPGIPLSAASDPGMRAGDHMSQKTQEPMMPPWARFGAEKSQPSIIKGKRTNARTDSRGADPLRVWVAKDFIYEEASDSGGSRRRLARWPRTPGSPHMTLPAKLHRRLPRKSNSKINMKEMVKIQSGLL
ncbi:uncharacterized protein [Vulpes vulpes]|uniref:Uncharacterized protein isoform X1 n=1 Tax=Vulpes vulpes TaxID=9627 RepID=A0ABM5ASZ0_VULVU